MHRRDVLEPTVPWTVKAAVNNADEVSLSYGVPNPAPYPLAFITWDITNQSASSVNFFQIEYGDPMFLKLGENSSSFRPQEVVMLEDYTDTDWV